MIWSSKQRVSEGPESHLLRANDCLGDVSLGKRGSCPWDSWWGGGSQYKLGGGVWTWT